MSGLLERKAIIEAEISAAIGEPVELTIRSASEFTLSGDGDIRAALERARARFFSCAQDWRTEYDAECDYSCAFFTITNAGGEL